MDHPNISSELTDTSTVGSTEPESILDPEDLFQWDSINISSQATCSIASTESESILDPEDLIQLDYISISSQATCSIDDRIPSTTPGAEPPGDARDSGSARSHSTHLETSSSDQP